MLTLPELYRTISYMIGSGGGFNQRDNKKILLIGAVVAFVAVLLVAGFFAWQFFSLKNDPDRESREAADRITKAVSQIYVVPGEEEPTVAQIQDKEKLNDQSFFDKAQDGDYLLVYTKEQLALIYREQDGKLVNVGPIATGGGAGQEQVLPQQAE